MPENYLTEEELYELLTKKPAINKTLALNFIRNYGNGRVLAAISESRKEQGDTTIQGLDKEEWEVRFENLNHSLNQLLHTLAEACR
jgi:hypothetical protein